MKPIERNATFSPNQRPFNPGLFKNGLFKNGLVKNGLESHRFAALLIRTLVIAALCIGPAMSIGPATSIGSATIASADEVASGTTTSTAPPRPQEEARRTYMGRIVAQPMSHLGANWLIRPERDDEENAREAFDQLGIERGMTLVDLGCGNGFWTLPMAKACKADPEAEATPGETDQYRGQVLAVDIQPEMLQKLRRNMMRSKVDNIVPILGKVDDPMLPAGEVDLVLLVDVYHEFSHPQSMLWSIHQSLKPDGVIALLEYRAEDPNVPIKPLHKMSKSQIIKEYEASDFKLVREYNDLPWQHLMFFARADSPLPKIEAKPFVAAIPNE